VELFNAETLNSSAVLFDRTFHITLGKKNIITRCINVKSLSQQNGAGLLANPFYRNLIGPVQLAFDLSDILKQRRFDMAVMMVIKIYFYLEILILVHISDPFSIAAGLFLNFGGG